LKGDQALLALGFCHELLNQPDLAKKAYDGALAARPNDGTVLEAVGLFHLRNNQREQAQRHFEMILKLQNLKPNELGQAQRALAIVLAASGDAKQAQKALEILGLLDESPRPAGAPDADFNTADARAKIVVLAQHPNPRRRRQAIDLLEKLAQHKVITQD